MGVVMKSYNPSTKEAKEGDLEFKARLGYT
jgi:hypothetical protein